MDKSLARKFVWSKLIEVAQPDSRFHFDFNQFIPDFEGSTRTAARLREMDLYRQASTVFITPDNCLEELRSHTLQDGKRQIVPTYGIRRGMVELDLTMVEDPKTAPFVVLLDAMEKIGRKITLSEIGERGLTLDWLVTGASAVNREGVRFGKGHGFFDLEWAMLYQVGAVDNRTPVIAFVHDCQVVDVPLDLSPYDTVCDFILTPSRIIEVKNPHKPTQGVMWDRLEPGMLADIPLLQELKRIEDER